MAARAVTNSSLGLRADLNLTRRDGFSLDISLSIEPGSTAALLGPNGAGKSTAVSALAGLIPIDAGQIALNDRVLDAPDQEILVPPEGRRIGVVFQDYLLFPHFTVRENVEFGLRRRGADRASMARTAGEWLEKLDLSGLADHKPGELSGGQAQRVALARALVTKPDLLLLDEPLAALDVSTRVELRRLLADHLAEFSGPRLLITHEPTEAFLLADVIHVIESGVITQVGSPGDIRLRPRTSYVADLAGSNLLVGSASGGVVTIDGHRLAVADTSIAGSVLVTIHPRSISLHRQRPEGSPRNSWEVGVTRIEHYGDRVRVQTAGPIPLTAEVTPGAVDALRVAVGASLWLSIKATEIGVEPG